MNKIISFAKRIKNILSLISLWKLKKENYKRYRSDIKNIKELYAQEKSREVKEFIRLFKKHGKKKRNRPSEIIFLSFTFYVPDCLSFLWQFKEIFVDKNYQFQFTAQMDPVIIDCGVNIGLSSLFFSIEHPESKIISIEADPEIFKICKNNIQNNVSHNIKMINKAVWINNESVSFSVSGNDAGSMFSSSGSQINVRALRLKNLLEDYERIDMLKIDIEGAEVDVILDCQDTLKRVQNLFVEYHSITGDDQSLGQLLNVLQKNKFRYSIENISKTKNFLYK